MSAKNKQTSMIILVLVVIVGAVLFYAYMSTPPASNTVTETTDIDSPGDEVVAVMDEDESDNEVTVVDNQEAAEVTEQTLENVEGELEEMEASPADTDEASAEMTDDAASASENGDAMSMDRDMQAAETSEAAADFDYPFSESILEMKAIGDEDAPVVMMEFSSLSCGHCGSFHQNAYKDIKRDYIDTGELRLVMVDFPLNLPAVQGAMLAHCLPEDEYFDFTQLLFTTQQDWLGEGDYLENLRQNAAMAGLSESEIDQCLNNQALQNAIVERNQAAQQQFAIQSTPSFVFAGDDEVISGARPFSFFQERIDAQLATEAE